MEIQQGNLIGRIYKLSTKCPFNFLHEAVHDFYHVDWDDMPFYYHSDHLGSAAWITGAAGSLVQYIMHAPYGEQLLYQHASWYDERFTFTGKERDTETGYTHYDARYLLPALSFWGSVDPLVDKYIYNSGYVYCGGYPIKFVDPNGMDIFRYDKETGDITLYKKTDDSYDLFGKFKYNRKTGEYELRTNKDGSIKTYKDHLGKNDKMAKGILRDGLNIKQDGSSFISDDNAGPTISDYFNFALILDEVAGVEVSGYVLEAPGEKNRKIDYITFAGIAVGMVLFFADSLMENQSGEFADTALLGNTIAALSGVTWAATTLFQRKQQLVDQLQLLLRSHEGGFNAVDIAADDILDRKAHALDASIVFLVQVDV